MHLCERLWAFFFYFSVSTFFATLTEIWIFEPSCWLSVNEISILTAKLFSNYMIQSNFMSFFTLKWHWNWHCFDAQSFVCCKHLHTTNCCTPGIFIFTTVVLFYIMFLCIISYSFKLLYYFVSSARLSLNCNNSDLNCDSWLSVWTYFLCSFKFDFYKLAECL